MGPETLRARRKARAAKPSENRSSARIGAALAFCRTRSEDPRLNSDRSVEEFISRRRQHAPFATRKGDYAAFKPVFGSKRAPASRNRQNTTVAS